MALKKDKDKEMTFIDYAIALTIIKQIRECFIEQTPVTDQDKPFARFVLGMFDDAVMELVDRLKKHGSDYAGTILDEMEGF